MHLHLPLVAIACIVTTLAACSRATPEPPATVTGPLTPATVATAASAGDTSVPDAALVFAPAAAASVDPGAGRSNKPMSPAQESAAMPLPGQNNDHSAPLSPAKAGSSP